jgi:selenocysteine lyase/cysteine desulfurase
LRAEFPGASRRVYFNSAGIGLASRAATTAIKDFVDLAELDPRGAHHGSGFAEAREAAARLVGADLKNIALVPSTSLALNIAADAVPLAGGENVVTTDLEFMSVIAPWFEKCRSVNGELRIARHERGRIDPQRVIDLIDDNTRAVTLSAVQWTNGYRIDVAPIGAECRKRSIPLIIDAIQQIGVIPFEAERNGVDFLACGGHKWLCSPSAMGFAYVSERFATEFRPSLSYVPTSKPPKETWQASWNDPAYDPVRTYALRETAARFEHGVHHGALGAAGLAAAINLLLDAGLDNVGAHVLRLASRVALGVSELGYEVMTPLEDEFRSGITAFRTRTAAEDDVALCEELAAHGIDMSVRYTSGVGGLRVSTHAYNDDDDVDRFIETLASLTQR